MTRFRQLTSPFRRAAGDIRVALLALALAAGYSLTVPETARGEDLCGPGWETLPVGECTCSPREGVEGGWMCPIGCCYKMEGEEELTTCLYGPWQEEPCPGGGSW